MEVAGGITFNKYGALSNKSTMEVFEKLIKLTGRIKDLESKIQEYESAFTCIWMELYGDSDESNRRITWDFLRNISMDEAFKKEYRGYNSMLKKLIELTHADDYEFVTETKLIKKKGKEVK